MDGIDGFFHAHGIGGGFGCLGGQSLMVFHVLFVFEYNLIVMVPSYGTGYSWLLLLCGILKFGVQVFHDTLYKKMFMLFLNCYSYF